MILAMHKLPLLLLFWLFGSHALSAQGVVVSEFMARNLTTLTDEDGDYSDWIEIENQGLSPVDLTGWFLTDDPRDLDQWMFPPDLVLEPGARLVVFASAKDRSVAGSPLHTNFRLSEEGEPLLLVMPDRRTVAWALAEPLPRHYPDISFGSAESREVQRLVTNASPMRYYEALDAGPATDWAQTGFDDSAWASGAQPIGYATDGPLANVLGLLARLVSTDDSMADTEINDALEAGEILAGTKTDIGIFQDVSTLVSRVNMGGGEGTFPGADPYPDGSNNGGYDGNDFVVSVTGSVVIPVGEWTIGFGSDDGGLLRLGGLTFEQEYNTNGDPGLDDTLFYNAPRGHSWTWGTINVSPAGKIVPFECYFYELGGGDSFEIAIAGGARATGPQEDPTGWVLLEDLALRWRVRCEFTSPPPPFEGLIATDLAESLKGLGTGVFCRYPFTVQAPEDWDQLLLNLRYDDGVAVYLNGHEVARRNAAEAGDWTSTADSARADALAMERETLDLTGQKGLLQAGDNVLAVHLLNASADESGLFLEVGLRLTRGLETVLGYMDEPTPGMENLPGYPEVADPPIFSRQSGLFQQAFALEMGAPLPGAEVRYTLDGKLPTESSPLANGAIPIEDTTRVRARTFAPGHLPSPVVSRVYSMMREDLSDFSSNLPIVQVMGFNTSVFVPDYWLDGFICMWEPGSDGRTRPGSSTPQAATLMGIKTHGSTSLDRPKKSYRFECRDEYGDDVDIPVLGLPAESDWILYGPYNFDRALIRNTLIYSLSNQVGPYAARTRFVEVFLHSGKEPVGRQHYMGVYAMMERVKRGPDRVDIEELDPGDRLPPAVTGGYITKIDRLDPGDVGLFAAGMTMGLVEPKEEEITAEQRAWLTGFYNQFSNVLHGANFRDPLTGYRAYIDVEEWIDHHLLNVLAKNVDALRLSTYMHIPREGRLTMGPIWDFDRSMGSYDGRDADPYTWNGTGDATRYFEYPWWQRLFQDPDFWDQYIARWQELRRGPLSNANIHATIDAMRDELQEAQVRNFERWPEVAPTRVADWQGEIDWLKTWLAQRADWMDSQFPATPQADPGSGIVEPGTQVKLSAPSGVVYYTADGSDPRLPGGEISPDAIAISWVSDWKTILSAGSNWRYWDLGYAPPNNWIRVDFDHTSWAYGAAELGYGDNQVTEISYGPNPSDKYPTAYFWRSVNIRTEGLWNYTLRLKRDDGAVVYWNGQELVRDLMPAGEIGFHTYANGTVAGEDENRFYEFPIPSELVINGLNSLAVEVHQVNATSSDLSFDAEIIAMTEDGSGSGGDTIAILEPTMIRARTRLDGRWSELGEFTYIFDELPQLAITELMYNPPPAPDSGFNNDDFEFIEIRNLGVNPEFMGGMTLENAVFFSFPVLTLEPGETVLVVKDELAFVDRYGKPTGQLAGEFSGNLSNDGEVLIFKDAAGRILSAFLFGMGAGWPPAAAGVGSSLEVLDTGGNYSDPANWRASTEWGGTPWIVTQPPIAVQVVGLEPEPSGAVRITFEVVAGRSYTVLTGSDLYSDDWAVMTELPTQPETGLATVLDPDAPLHNKRFYRVIAR